MTKLRILGGILLGITVMLTGFSLSPIITADLFRIFGFHPQAYLRDLISSVVGLVMLAIVGATIGHITAPKQIAFFQSLVDATREMAKGNFNVTIDTKRAQGGDRRLGELVRSINNMAEELGHLEKMRQEFVSNVSHEIQSPLTSIMGFVQALKRDDLKPEKRLHYLDIIEAESLRLSKLSDNLLKLTSLESQHHPFHPQPVRLDSQLRNIVLTVEPQWIQKGIQVDVELEDVRIMAVEDLLNQLWMNLLGNAIKFTPENGNIRLLLQLRNDKAIVCISDTGIGISQVDQERVFERFFKADRSRNRATPGSGLGLAIVKKIVDLHHGTISVDSDLKVGTRFTVQLPLEYRPV